MLYIENVSLKDIIKGDHWNRGKDSILIQIADPGDNFPKPAVKFERVLQFHIKDYTDVWHDYNDPKVFNLDQANEILQILVYALNTDRNVTVHCNAGISRSAAVAQVGSYLQGFTRKKPEWQCYPNERILKLMEIEISNNFRDYI